MTRARAPLAARARTRFTLFAALRLLEQAFADQPRLGESRKAADDPVRLGQAPTPGVRADAMSRASTADESGRPARSSNTRFGVFGPNGALPLHLTELAYERRRHSEDATSWISSTCSSIG